MKSFTQYLAEAEQHQYRPQRGDTVGFEINDELLIESRVIEVFEDGVVLELDSDAIGIMETANLIQIQEDDQVRSKYLHMLHNAGFDDSAEAEQARETWKSITGQTHPAHEEFETKKQQQSDWDDRMSGVVRSSDRKYSVTVEKDDDGDVVKNWFRLEGPGVKPNTFIDWNPYDTMSTEDLDLYIKLGMPSREDIGSIGPLNRKDLHRLANQKGLMEAKYKGRTVKLGKPTRTPGGPKKFSVFVKNPKTGNVKKVNFGDPNMEIKRDDPKRRKNFRARHGCGTGRASDRTKAAYWSCKLWSKKPVSKITKEQTESE